MAREASTVWRQVATGDRWLRASGGYGRQVATGDGLSELGAAGS